jgi:hypothetical protein
MTLTSLLHLKLGLAWELPSSSSSFHHNPVLEECWARRLTPKADAPRSPDVSMDRKEFTRQWTLTLAFPVIQQQ